MPAQAITTTPTIVANLTAGTAYTFQNRSPHVIYMQATDTAPTDPDNAFAVGPNTFGTMEKEGTEEVYMWTDSVRVGAGRLVYDEAV